MWGVAVGVVVVVLVFGLFRWGFQPHTALRMEGGRVVVERGDLPPRLVSELAELGLQGSVYLAGSGDRLQITVDGLTEGEAQRVRNVVHLHRQALR